MKSGQPVEISKVIFIVAVCAITSLLVLGITYIAPANQQAPSEQNSVWGNPALEESIYNRYAMGPASYPSMKGKMKPVAPWQK